MRYLPGVIDEILEEVPEDMGLLREALLSLRESCRYSAPEQMGSRWYTAADILTASIGKINPPPSWARRVQMIFNEPWRN